MPETTQVTGSFRRDSCDLVTFVGNCGTPAGAGLTTSGGGRRHGGAPEQVVANHDPRPQPYLAPKRTETTPSPRSKFESWRLSRGLGESPWHPGTPPNSSDPRVTGSQVVR